MDGPSFTHVSQLYYFLTNSKMHPRSSRATYYYVLGLTRLCNFFSEYLH